MAKLFSGVFLSAILTIVILLVLNYFRLLPTLPQTNNQLAFRYEQTKYYPFDPLSPMVKNLRMDYAISGIVIDKKQVSPDTWQLVLGLPNDPVNIPVNISSKDNPTIVDSQHKPITLEQILTHYNATISLTADKKTGEQKVYYIYVQQ